MQLNTGDFNNCCNIYITQTNYFPTKLYIHKLTNKGDVVTDTFLSQKKHFKLYASVTFSSSTIEEQYYIREIINSASAGIYRNIQIQDCKYLIPPQLMQLNMVYTSTRLSQAQWEFIQGNQSLKKFFLKMVKK